ncbi:MAG: IPT/TIG domain-containing protein [Gemmatimonadota bacterium]
MGLRSYAPKRAFAAVFTVSVTLACGDVDVGPDSNPVPILQGADPAVVPGGAGPIDVGVLGLGFAPDAEVRWNGEARPTTYLDATLLSVELAAADIAGGSGALSVFNPEPGGGTSVSVPLIVGHPRPFLASIAPTDAPAVLTTSLELQVYGSDFVTTAPGARVLWEGVPLSTVILSATNLVASVPDYLLRVGRSAAVTVRNPGPGGGESAAVFFGIVNPVPIVTGTSPGGIEVATPTELDVLGSGFVHRSSVLIDGTRLQPISRSETRLTVQVPGALAVAGTTLSLSVENPTPGGGVSNPVVVDVWQDPPRIDELFPSRVFAGAVDFTLVIAGTDFEPAATATWNGSPKAITVVHSGRIEMAVPAADVAVEGSVEIVVKNPGNGGEAMAELRILRLSSGTVLLAESSGGDLVLMDIDGSEIVQARPSGGAYRVDASPISGMALYQSGRVFEMDPFTGQTRRVTTSSENNALRDEQWARYSADGQWIYFMGQSSSTGHWQLWRAPAFGGAPEPILVSSSESYGYPAPSHIGDRVVYSVGVSQGATELRILDLTTLNSVPLGVPGATARWTPDDQWIVYWTFDRQLRAIRPDGTNDFSVTSGPQVAAGFDVSPSGDYIIAAREDGSSAVLIEFPSGRQFPLNTGAVGSMAWYGP